MTTTSMRDMIYALNRAADALELIAERLKPEVMAAESLQVDDLAPRDSGWHQHYGRALPIAPGETVQVRFRNGSATKPMSFNEARTLSWEHGDTDLDIVAYRVVT